MAEAFKFFSGNSSAALIIAITIALAGLCAMVLCVAAFVQGRSITLWPPGIGEKPAAQALAPPETPREKTFESVGEVGAGTRLQAASGIMYLVTRTFYTGATATIYMATDPKQTVVIAKVFWRGLTPNSTPWQLFQQEQRTATILTHRNVVKTLDRGLQAGHPFIIMEFMGGGTLRDWITSHDTLPGRDILAIVSQVADAIDYAHSMGVIHRDIKPGNILLEGGPADRVALSDFGIAVILGAVQRNITAIGQEFAGSPGYLAPELLRGEKATVSVDIYSFGIVLYEMISGHGPFDDLHETYALMFAKAEKDPPDIRVFRPEAPEPIAERLTRTLSRDPTVRPSTARGVLSGLESAIGSL